MIDVFKCFGTIMGGCVHVLQDFTIYDSVSYWDIVLGFLVVSFGVSLIHFVLSTGEDGK